nr:MAG TPA: hypothetical protein [Caudoviricetes sp.]
MNSQWGYRGEILKNFGWSYDYLLWGISWLNLQTMLNDAPRIKDIQQTNADGTPTGKEIIHRELKTKEDIKKYIKGII